MKKILYFWLVVFSIITYKAQTTTWNGSSWSNGKPDASKDAIISADYSQSANLAVKNKDQIYNALLRLMANLSLYNKMKSQAREYIVQRYDQKLIWNAILAEYREMIK